MRIGVSFMGEALLNSLPAASAECRSRCADSLAARGARLAAHRLHEQQGDRDREQPPRVDALVREEPHERERHREPDGDAPVVPDDEVPPEAAERRDVLHALLSAGFRAVRRRLSERVSANDTSAMNATMPKIARSDPGQSTPAPSPPQKTPKLVRSRPTAYLSVFSGTRS